MKTPLRLLAGLLFMAASWMPAQESTPVAPTAATFAPDQIDQLLGPIALYPDSMLALILPASTSPVDVVLATRYLAAGGDPGQIDLQPWDESIRSLARYPDVLRWMDANLAWTAQLGRVFAAQPNEVMLSIQHLRALASWAGTLTGSAEQTVIYQSGVIRIVPAQPGVIYLPIYDPGAVYGPNPSDDQTTVSFTAGYETGLWLNFEFDWNRRTLWVADWRSQGGGPRSVVEQIGRRGGPERRAWQPPSVRRSDPTPESSRPGAVIVRPAPFRTAPASPPPARSADRGRSDPASRPSDNVPRRQPAGVGPPAADPASPHPATAPRASHPDPTVDPATPAAVPPVSRNPGNPANRPGGTPLRTAPAPAVAASPPPAAPVIPPAGASRGSRPQPIGATTPAAPETAPPEPPVVRSRPKDQSAAPAAASTTSPAVTPPAAAPAPTPPPGASRDFRPSPTRPSPTTPPESSPPPPSLGRERPPTPPAPPPTPSASVRPGPPPAPPAPPAPAPSTTPADDKKKKEQDAAQK